MLIEIEAKGKSMLVEIEAGKKAVEDGPAA